MSVGIWLVWEDDMNRRFALDLAETAQSRAGGRYVFAVHLPDSVGVVEADRWLGAAVNARVVWGEGSTSGHSSMRIHVGHLASRYPSEFRLAVPEGLEDAVSHRAPTAYSREQMAVTADWLIQAADLLIGERHIEQFDHAARAAEDAIYRLLLALDENATLRRELAARNIEVAELRQVVETLTIALRSAAVRRDRKSAALVMSTVAAFIGMTTATLTLADQLLEDDAPAPSPTIDSYIERFEVIANDFAVVTVEVPGTATETP